MKKKRELSNGQKRERDGSLGERELIRDLGGREVGMG